MENVNRESLQLILLNFISSMLLYNKFYIEWQNFSKTQIVNIKYIGKVFFIFIFVYVACWESINQPNFITLNCVSLTLRNRKVKL